VEGIVKGYLYDSDRCMACTSCTVVCPVAAATREFLGPKMVGPALSRFRRPALDPDLAADLCSNCKNCDISCPSGVPISTLNMLSKAEYYRHHRHRLRDWVLSHGQLMGNLATPFVPLSNLAIANPISRTMLGAFGFAGRMPLPAYVRKTFRKQFRALRQQSFPQKVVFFPGCYIDFYDPGVGLDFVAVMQANEYEVVVPRGLGCCGTPMVANGFPGAAERAVRRNVRALQEWTDAGVPVVACCTSCSLTLKQEQQELFDVPGAAELAARVYDATEFLLELRDRGKLKTDLKQLSGRYLYHAPCHLRDQGIGRPGFEMLGSLPGLEISDADAGCCGLSGSYGFKGDRYEVAQAVGDVLFKKVRASGADAVISECGTCRHQITVATGAKTLHPISVMRRAFE
jgi:glycerol-3-phosphate dehydrogenase subunit C